MSTLGLCLIRKSRITHNLYSGCKLLHCHKIRYKPETNAVIKEAINILGIETSCDDTGTAIVNESGQVLGEGYYSQAKTSVKLGGVIPTVARKYHEKYIDQAVEDAFSQSGLQPEDITAVAATVKPGNTCTLTVGCEYGKRLALKHNLPFIPIHHMEAHALTARMHNKVEFPFVVLLVSGGHCLLGVVDSVHEWSVVGETVDSAPGCVFDQVARRMKLRNLRGLDEVNGGKAIEMMAAKGDPARYPFPAPMSRHRDANFSFSGIESHTKSIIKQLEREKGIEGGRVLDEACDLCASFQHSAVQHLVRRTHRGLGFIEATGRIDKQNKTLVISGGVACNHYLRDAFQVLCESEGYTLVIPSPKLCTDNGIMIAWNGVERWRAGKGIIYDTQQIQAVTVHHKCALGPNLSDEHVRLNIKNPKWIKIGAKSRKSL